MLDAVKLTCHVCSSAASSQLLTFTSLLVSADSRPHARKWLTRCREVLSSLPLPLTRHSISADDALRVRGSQQRGTKVKVALAQCLLGLSERDGVDLVEAGSLQTAPEVGSGTG